MVLRLNILPASCRSGADRGSDFRSPSSVEGRGSPGGTGAGLASRLVSVQHPVKALFQRGQGEGFGQPAGEPMLLVVRQDRIGGIAAGDNCPDRGIDLPEFLESADPSHPAGDGEIQYYGTERIAPAKGLAVQPDRLLAVGTSTTPPDGVISGDMVAGCPKYGYPDTVYEDPGTCAKVATFTVQTCFGQGPNCVPSCVVTLCNGEVAESDEIHCYISNTKPTSTELDSRGQYDRSTHSKFGDPAGCRLTTKDKSGSAKCYVAVHWGESPVFCDGPYVCGSSERRHWLRA